MDFDFSGVQAPTSTEYLKPGIYTLAPEKVELVEKEGKTPLLNITFSGKEGQVQQKFYLTPKALPNLQYLHEGLFGKPITKGFENVKQLHAYFEKALTTKRVEKTFLVGATQAETGKIYCELPYARFIVNEDTPYTLGEFEEGSSRYKDVVKLAKKTAASNSDDVMLSDSTKEEDDLPW